MLKPLRATKVREINQQPILNLQLMRVNKITEVYSQSQDKIVSLRQLAQFSYIV